MNKIYLRFTETISHQFSVDINKLPKSVDQTCSDSVYAWIAENEDMDFSNGESHDTSSTIFVTADGLEKHTPEKTPHEHTTKNYGYFNRNLRRK